MHRIFLVIAAAALAVAVVAGTLPILEESQDMVDTPRIFRIILPVNDIDRAARFYGQLLNMEGERVAPGRHYFHCGETILAIVDPRADGDDWDARPNQDHIYFAVSDLESVHERATALGGLSEDMGTIEKRPWGEVSFYMKDPFGNPLCFVDEKTLFTGLR
ncbi:MAG TPA: VOC family protein [Vicinamibacteria bacterium]|nr:VOC family protein [Vicinamibacteria bacterium]